MLRYFYRPVGPAFIATAVMIACTELSDSEEIGDTAAEFAKLLNCTQHDTQKSGEGKKKYLTFYNSSTSALMTSADRLTLTERVHVKLYNASKKITDDDWNDLTVVTSVKWTDLTQIDLDGKTLNVVCTGKDCAQRTTNETLEEGEKHDSGNGFPIVACDEDGAKILASKILALRDEYGAYPQTPSSVVTASPVATVSSGLAIAGRRVALVIGNGDYTNVPDLPNPPNDADDIAAALRRIGFTVHEAKDLGRNAFRDALAEFSNDALGAEVAFMFYAGHGMEVGGENYLVPVDASLTTDLRVRFEAIPLDEVMAALQGVTKLRVVVLDACRNNPFVASMRVTTANRAITRGFDRIEPAVGTLVSYSAKDGTTAADGSGRNSPYTRALLADLNASGVEVNKLFRLVRDQVLAATSGQQEPYTYGATSSEDVFLNLPTPAAGNPISTPSR